MYLNFLDTVGMISKKEDVIRVIANIAKISEDEIDVAAINKRADEENNFRYFTESFKEVDQDDPRITFLWLDTGYLCNHTFPIYVSFRKSPMGYIGGFAGTEKTIV